MVVAENSILLALPVLASFNVSTLLELHGRSLCGIWLFWNIKVLRLNRLACSRRFTNLRGLTRSRWFPCGRRLACPFGLADFCRLTNTRRLACSCGFARSRRFYTRLL